MKAMVLAAGLGERMRPLTDHLPKPLLPIANRPVMAYILEHLARHGFTEVIANLHYRGPDIVDCFGDGSCCGVHLTYTEEKKLWGIAGGMRRCKDFFGDETFLVIGSDDLTDMDLTALLEHHRRTGAIASIGLVEVEETSQFGIVVTDQKGRIERFVEKPKGRAPSNTANTQIYLFEPAIFDFIPPDTVYDLGFDTFPKVVEAGAPFCGVRLPGYWRDIGSIRGYLEAHEDVMLGRVQARIEGEQVRPGIWIGEGSDIHPEAELTPPVALGQRCVIRAGAALSGATAIGADAEVGAGSSLHRSAVWPGARVPPAAALRDAVVLDDTVVRATDGPA